MRDSNILREMMKLYMTELFGICVMKHANEACSRASFHVESNFCSLRRPTKGQIRVAFGRNRPKMSFAVSVFIVRKSLSAKDVIGLRRTEAAHRLFQTSFSHALLHLTVLNKKSSSQRSRILKRIIPFSPICKLSTAVPHVSKTDGEAH